jgi:hypothetical protein
MSETVRTLNENGIAAFRQFLIGLQSGETVAVPAELLTSDDTSMPFAIDLEVALQQFRTKLDAATYLHGVFGNIDQQLVSHNGGLWSWLALFYFDQLLPVGADGQRRRALADTHYILASHDGHYDWRTYYRHLLATPYDILRRYGESAGVLLCGPVHSHGDWLEQLGSRQELITSEGLISAVNALYLNPAAEPNRPCWKRGSLASADRAGSLRRFIKIVAQLDLTYDLYGMEAGQILGLLPAEFVTWLPPATPGVATAVG